MKGGEKGREGGNGREGRKGSPHFYDEVYATVFAGSCTVMF